MSTEHDQAMLEQRVFRYLYDDLTADERRRFDTELAHNPALQAVLDAERQLDALLPRGMGPVLDSGRVQGNFAAVLGRVHQQSPTAMSWRDQFAWLLRSPALLSAQTLALAFAFGLGLQLNTATPPSADTAGLSPLDLVDEGDYEIYQMEINSFDAGTGAIDLSFSLASDSRFVGNVADAGVRALIDVALRNDIDDEARLDSVEVLQYALQDSPGSRQAPAGLLHALANDLNPGVRYDAATTLTNYANQESVRGALRQALLEDTNPGVRMLAFDTLAEEPDALTIDVFRQRMVADSNDYIRNRARSIVDTADGGIPRLY
ncbi:MAG: hypothetical protein RLZZ385_2064 [Pseudomonadota bacterium]|jgi:hypothetical protein